MFSPKKVVFFLSSQTDETSETTEQKKINISPLLFAIIVLADKEDDTNAGNKNNGACQAV